VSSIRDFEVDIETEEGRLTIANDFVLAMTGYLPAFDFLTALGVEIGTDEYQTPIHNSETMMTNVDGIYLAGVICGGLKTNKWFIENSRIHAEQIINHILKTGLSQAG
jgi:thioredoxin reductase